MSRAPVSGFGRLGNPTIAFSSLEPAGSKPRQVKPKVIKLILPSQVLGIIMIGQGLVGSVSG